MKTNSQEYRQIMVRPLDLAMCECWDIGERINLPRKFKELLYFDPLFIYKPGEAVTVYYNFTDPKQNLHPLIEFLENNPVWFLEQKKSFDADCVKTRQVIKDGSADAEALRRAITEIWPMIAVANVLGSTESYTVSQRLREVCVKVRNESDDVLHPTLTLLSAGLKEKISETRPWLADYCPYISLSEFRNENFPDQNTLSKRSAGYLFHEGTIFFDPALYAAKKGIILTAAGNAAGSDTIKGRTASPGSASGTARIIIELADLKKVNEGDIIVCPMTTPDMALALAKAAGIVTDEGGITCHAAIIARELKKPCVIGTKIATKSIKDGDRIAIDADNASVKIERLAG